MSSQVFTTSPKEKKRKKQKGTHICNPFSITDIAKEVEKASYEDKVDGKQDMKDKK